jgi:predicted cupin superfamily sugar epimerase
MQDALQWILKLNLQPHPEGGHYREIYRSVEQVEGLNLKDKRKGQRSLATSIYFLLKSGDKSCFHRLKSDEIWYYQQGSPIHLYCIDEQGNLKEIFIGPESDQHQVLQTAIPAGTIFGARVHGENTYSLAGCMVSPGFSFEDFEILSRDFLLEKYPRHKDIIISLSCESKTSTHYY